MAVSRAKGGLCLVMLIYFVHQQHMCILEFQCNLELRTNPRAGSQGAQAHILVQLLGRPGIPLTM